MAESGASEFFGLQGLGRKESPMLLLLFAVLLDTLAPLRKQIANLEKEFPAIQENWIVIAR